MDLFYNPFNYKDLVECIKNHERRRYDDTNSKIKYIGNWNYWPLGDSHSANDYSKTAHTNAIAGDNIKFNFKGSEIRIIAENRADTYYADNTVYIDGLNVGEFRSDGYSKTTNNYTGMIMQYELTGLDFAEHSVEIKCTRNSYWYFDAIDIDNNGQLLEFNESMLLNKSTMDLDVADTQQLIATTSPAAVSANVTWTSSDSSIATVYSNGKVIGVKEGTCNITATTADGLTATCTVTVTKLNESITLDKSTIDLNVGNSGVVTATTTTSGASVTWTSSDSSVATVDSSGKVTAIGVGTATITATTTDGSNLSESCTVTVTNPTNSTGTDGTTNIVNAAYAKGDNTNNAGGEVSIIFNGVPDTTLSVVKTADVKSVWVGDTFTYTIVATNTGSKTAKSVVIKDSAPNHIDFIVDGITTTQGKVDSSSTLKNIMVNVGDVPPLGTVTIKIPANVIL